MKPLFSLSFCCFLFVLPGLMTSCGEPTSKQEPAAIPAKPAVEKIVEAPEKPQAEKPVAKPEASAATASKKEPVAAPTKPEVENPAEQPVVSKSVAAPDKAQVEKPDARPETSAAVAATKEPVAAPEKPNVGKTVFKYPLTIKATVKNSEEYEYRTGFGGDEQGASIKVQAGHFEKSEIVRDASTGFEPVYKYKPKGDYVGKDSVELWLVEHEIGSGPDDPGKTTKTRVVINLTIAE